MNTEIGPNGFQIASSSCRLRRRDTNDHLRRRVVFLNAVTGGDDHVCLVFCSFKGQPFNDYYVKLPFFFSIVFVIVIFAFSFSFFALTTRVRSYCPLKLARNQHATSTQLARTRGPGDCRPGRQYSRDPQFSENQAFQGWPMGRSRVLVAC